MFLDCQGTSAQTRHSTAPRDRLKRFAAEVAAVLVQTEPLLRMIVRDADVHQVQDFSGREGAKLLLKFYEVGGGEITLGGVNINQLSHHRWRELCGIVMQDGYICSDTILMAPATTVICRDHDVGGVGRSSRAGHDMGKHPAHSPLP